MSSMDAQTRIAELEAELASARRELQAFTHAVSHDLRAPLRHIVSFSRLVQDEAGPVLTDELRGFLETVTQSSQQLGQMLTGLTELARLGQSPVVWETVALQPLLAEVWAELQQLASMQTAVCAIEVGGVQVRADRQLLRTALAQCLGNACKFTPVGVPAQIHISASLQADQRVALHLADQGIGWDPAQREHLFKPFGRLQGSKTYPGLGLGLLTALRAMQKLDGQIDMTVNPSQGCTVILVLQGA
ncbi:MAG: HAMP domain-containing sensor histidine kinase [Rhodoferax sp.]|nr:HAMP domain-containing sensor histidine kinase [Rhodoferax sp.]